MTCQLEITQGALTQLDNYFVISLDHTQPPSIALSTSPLGIFMVPGVGEDSLPKLEW